MQNFIILHDKQNGSSILVNADHIAVAYVDQDKGCSTVSVDGVTFYVKEHIDSIKKLIDVNKT